MSNELEPGALSKTLIDMASEALLALSPEGDVLSWNEGAGVLFGCAASHAIGKRFEALMDGARPHAAGALHQARREGGASEFVANMSHELRTPLNSVIGFAELMVTEKVGPLSDNHKEYLGDILASSKHLLQLINDVLDLAKVESGKIEIRPEPIDVQKIVAEVRDILRGLAGERRTKIDFDVSAAPSHVVLDAAKFKQVLYNYLSNAIKFTPDGGFVKVRVLAEGAEQLRIEVEDTGIGVRHEDLHRLFIEFQQLDSGTTKKYAGTGLGLAVTKRIVEAQGGSVGVRSAIGRGSTFWASLPLQVVEKEPALSSERAIHAR